MRSLVGAFVEGIQGGANGLTSTGVAAVVKHWVGYGASRDGFDGHNYYGRFSAFPSGRFQDHVDAFLDAFQMGVAGVMPTYNILEGVTLDGESLEPAGAGFSEQLLNGLLRGVYGYNGLIVSDWSITKDSSESCRIGVPEQTPHLIAMPWGVEELSRVERFAKGINAGIDQFGGENDPSPLTQAVHDGLVSEARIDESVLRILEQKFALGLFDNPFVDATAASSVIGCSEFVAAGAAAQCRSLVVLKGVAEPALSRGNRVFLHGQEPSEFEDAGLRVTTQLGDADVAVVRLSAPYELLHPGHFFGRRQHEGALDFKDGHPDYEALKRISARVPTVVIVHLDRPAILTSIRDRAKVLIAEFGVDDAAIVAVLLGDAKPLGRLPFQLPSSMASVLTQPCDSAVSCQDALYPFSFSFSALTTEITPAYEITTDEHHI